MGNAVLGNAVMGNAVMGNVQYWAVHNHGQYASLDSLL